MIRPDRFFGSGTLHAGDQHDLPNLARRRAVEPATELPSKTPQPTGQRLEVNVRRPNNRSVPPNLDTIIDTTNKRF